jgi:hypothetical protein
MDWLLRDYSTQIVSTAAIITGFIVLFVAQFFKDHPVAKVFLVVAAGLLDVAAISATFYSQHQIVAAKSAEAIHQKAIRESLRELYAEAGPIIDRKLGTEPDPKSDAAINFLRYKNDDVVAFVQDAEQWESKTAKWLVDNLGLAAKERLFDLSSLNTLGWGPPEVRVTDDRYSIAKNKIIAEKRNLSAIMESTVYNE